MYGGRSWVFDLVSNRSADGLVDCFTAEVGVVLSPRTFPLDAFEVGHPLWEGGRGLEVGGGGYA